LVSHFLLGKGIIFLEWNNFDYNLILGIRTWSWSIIDIKFKSIILFFFSFFFSTSMPEPSSRGLIQEFWIGGGKNNYFHVMDR
jgi:hypothetical protein